MDQDLNKQHQQLYNKLLMIIVLDHKSIPSDVYELIQLPQVHTEFFNAAVNDNTFK